MTHFQVKQVEELCSIVKKLCQDVTDEAIKEETLFITGSPTTAELRRRSMDLTRALARLRGRGRF